MSKNKINTTFEVDSEFEGQRLDLYLSQKLTTRSRSQLKKQIQADSVKVNGEVEYHPQYRVKTGDKVEIEAEFESKTKKIEPVEMPLNIVAETSDYLVLNKPAGIVVHPGSGHYRDTLANGIKYYLKSKGEDQLGMERAGLIHRLDKGTSGIIMVAKSPQALWYISSQFAARKVSKAYLCIIKGHILDKFSVTTEVGRDKHNRQKFSSRTSSGKRAYTEFLPLLRSTKPDLTLVAAYPQTGRTHQIRVHLSESGYPIVGDRKYGGSTMKLFKQDLLPRLLLHAYRLELSVDPDSNHSNSFQAFPDESFWRLANFYGISTPKPTDLEREMDR